MLQILDVNPFAEAMFYYWGRANGENIGNNLVKLIRQFPSYKEALEKAAKPALALEKLLDSKLKSDNPLIDSFFKKIEIENGRAPSSLVGFCLASLMTNNLLTGHPELSTDELCKSMRKQKGKKLIKLFCTNISARYEVTLAKESSAVDFSKHLKALPIDSESKYLILDSVFNYKEYVNKLIDLIMPASKIIKAAEKEYQSAIDEFKTLYSGDNAQAFFKSAFCSFPKLPIVEITRIAPTLFGLTTVYGRFATAINDDTDNVVEYISPTISSYIGIANHIVGNRSPQDEVAMISENMKTLSDRKRLEMLFYLCSHRAYGQELCTEFDLKQPTMSYHIQKLLDAGFLTVEFSGNRTYYTADKAGIQRMLDAFAEKIK